MKVVNDALRRDVANRAFARAVARKFVFLRRNMTAAALEGYDPAQRPDWGRP